MAKLGNSTTQQTPPGGESSDRETTSSQATKPSIRDTQKSQSSEQAKPRTNVASSSNPLTSQNPFPSLGMARTNGETPKINITSQRPLTPQKQDGSTRSSSRAGESLDDWEDRELCNIFRITLGPGNKNDSHGHSLNYLGATRAELEESEQPMRLSTSMLDQALLEAASNLGKGATPLNYLLECWKRVSRKFRTLRKNGEGDPKFQIVKEARRLCMSYCIFAVTMPEMFGYAREDCRGFHLLSLSQLRFCNIKSAHATPSGGSGRGSWGMP